MIRVFERVYGVIDQVVVSLCQVSVAFFIEGFVVQLSVGFLYILLDILDDYGATFVSICNDNVVSLLEFFERSSFVFSKVVFSLCVVFW